MSIDQTVMTTAVETSEERGGALVNVSDGMQPHWAEIMVDVRVASVDRSFHYAIPVDLQGQVGVGHRVLVPFGNRPNVEGYVVGVTDEPPPLHDVKAIRQVLDEEPVFSREDLAVARWISQHYMCLLVQALQCFLPPGSSLRRSRQVTERQVRGYRLGVSIEAATQFIIEMSQRAPRQTEILARLLVSDGAVIPASELAQGAGYGSLRALEQRGLISEVFIRQYRRPDDGLGTQAKVVPDLTAAQERAVTIAKEGLSRSAANACTTVLLHGVTGSGKTEVYMRIIGAALKDGRGAILLVPDISLTPQTVGRFRSRFGEQIAILHSRLSEGERYDEWLRIRQGDAKVVVGARSAVFAPVQQLSVIVIDEEHETSYKQDEAPRYHARKVAEARLQQVGGLLVLGSATPSLETFHQVRKGDLTYAGLPERAQQQPMPYTEIIDMREELLAGNRTMFSRALQAELVDTLARGEQAIVLLNRRGFASFLLCRECGCVPRCRDCGVSLTLHQNPPGLRCHYCGDYRRVPTACPDCTGPYLRPFGVGTQRVEQDLKQLFQSARIARMDRDTTTRKGAHQRILAAFAKREIDILVGTQMVAKGLDFPAVTLVGVVSADTALHFPDFRAAERTFQLLAQVAGRAGRGELPGKVVLQTYTPDHYAIQAASRHDYAEFVDQELTYRRDAGYPPYAKLVRVLITGEDEKEVAKVATGLSIDCPNDVQVVGPSPAPLSKLKGKIRWHLLVKGEAQGVENVVRGILQASNPHASVSVVVDVDPLSLL